MIDSQNLPFVLLFAIIFIVVIMIVVTVFIVKSRSKLFEKELEKRNLEIEFQKQIFLKTIEIQENERKRIAQDLHDDISSKLIALSLNLHLLQSDKTKDSEKKDIINTIESINNTTIETSRKIAHELFPPLLEKFGLCEALEEIVSEYNKSKQIQINFKNQVDLSNLEKEKQLHTYRIIQELINNSIKHGTALLITIAFKSENSKITCSYTDNGIGLDKTRFESAKGLGFINIESRLKSIGGNYQIDFSMQGFNLQFEF